MDTYDVEHLLRLKNEHERRLKIREMQAARFGVNCPPEIIMEIEDIKSAIEDISTKVNLFSLHMQFQKSRRASLTLNWKQIQSIANQYTSINLSGRYQEVYHPDFYAHREYAEEHISRFLASRKRAMILIGKAGMGKSSIVCHLVTRLRQENRTIWLQDCAQEATSDNLSIAAESTVNIFDLWSNRFYLQEEELKYVDMLIIFDALNEHIDPNDLLKKISNCLLFHHIDNIKLIIVCRDPAWRSLRNSLQVPYEYVYQPMILKNEVEIDAFEDNELHLAYENYARELQISQKYDGIAEQVKSFIKNPLFFGLTMRLYGGRNTPLPENISLRKIFNEYILQSIGMESDDPRHLIINRMIDYLYEVKQRSMDVDVLQKDPLINQYVVPSELRSPFGRLIDTGFITQEMRLIGVTKRSNQIYVTYERVFEYLLADLVINPHQPITRDDIELVVRLAVQNIFTSLLGALELALSFRILDNPEQRVLITLLSDSDEPHLRQLLIDILHTIKNEDPSLARQIVQELSAKSDRKHQIMACLLSYHLRYTDYLTYLAKSKDTSLSHFASLCIYRIWDDYRRRGQLDEGYLLIRDLAKYAKFPHILRDQRALFALLSVSAHMLRHLLSSPEDLAQLSEILSETLQTLPGLGRNSRIRVLLNQISEVLTIVGFQLIQILTLRPDVAFSNKKVMDAFFGNRSDGTLLIRSFNDVTDYPTLLGHEDELLFIMNQEHPIIPWLFAGVLIYHGLKEPVEILSVLEYLFEQGRFQARFWITYAITAICIIRVSRQEEIHSEVLTYLYDYAFTMWLERHNPEIKLIATGERTDTSQAVLLMEAMKQQYTGIQSSSHFMNMILSDADNPVTLDDIENVLDYLEFLGYQGYPTYMLQVLFSNFRPHWEVNNVSRALNIVAAVRSIYPEEVDEFIRSNSIYKIYWDLVKISGVIPDIATVWYANGQIWALGMFSGNTTLKLSYLIIRCLSYAKSTNDFLRNAVRIVLRIIREPDRLDELFIRTRLQKDLSWSNYARYDVPAAVYERVLAEMTSQI